MTVEGTDVPKDRVLVGFSGDGAGLGEMSWGQWGIWLSMASHESWMPLGGTKPLEPGTSVRDVAEELRYLMSRFPSMRTRLRFDADGRPTQEVFGAGEIALEIYDTDGVRDSASDELAAVIEARYRASAYDFAADWPVRMAVVRHRGVLTRMVVIMCHLVTDSAGAAVMLREVEARRTAPVTGMQQLEQARWQRSAAGQRQNAVTLRFWESFLRTIEPRRLPDSTDRREPRHWSAEFRSRALLDAVEAIAERTESGSSPVLMALFAVSLARITAINPVVIRPVVHNRFRPGLAGVVCQVAQSGICSLDLADITVAEAVERARRATMVAYKHAYYDPEQHAALVAQIARERGPEFDIACFFNDRRAEDRQATASTTVSASPITPLTEKEPRRTQSESTFRWSEKKANPYERMFVHVDDDPAGILVTVCADTHYFSPAQIEALARGMEQAAIEAASDPSTPAFLATALVPCSDRSEVAAAEAGAQLSSSAL